MPIFNSEYEIQQGKAAARKVMETKADFRSAFNHPRLGPIDLLFNDYKTGIRHILYRRENEKAGDARLANQIPEDLVLKLIEVIILGTEQFAQTKYIITYDSHRAILAIPQGGYRNPWLLSGYRIIA